MKKLYAKKTDGFASYNGGLSFSMKILEDFFNSIFKSSRVYNLTITVKFKMYIPQYNFKESKISDGNCLFRAFSYFLYNIQEKHRRVRLKNISNVVKN